MKLKEFLENINKRIKEDPSLLELDLYAAVDDEGNGYNSLGYFPSIRYIDKSECQHRPEYLLAEEEFEDPDYDKEDYKQVLLF